MKRSTAGAAFKPEGLRRVNGPSPFLNGWPKMRLPNKVVNKLLAWMVRFFFRMPLTDEATCYKAFRTDVLRSLRLTQDDFAIEAELTGEVCRRGLRIYQLPIAYYGRTYAEGKKITWRDGVKAVFVLLQVRLRS